MRIHSRLGSEKLENTHWAVCEKIVEKCTPPSDCEKWMTEMSIFPMVNFRDKCENILNLTKIDVTSHVTKQ